MAPQNYKKRVAVPYEKDCFLKNYFAEVYDLLGDQSIFGIELSGHSKSQMGIYIPEHKILFAADACWGEYFVDKSQNMRFLPRLVQNNYTQYLSTIENIRRLKKDFPEIEVIFSHGNFEEKEYGE
jgi:glyoxylase-like metal-dependent hydrolase (beta-lactamase superfamily II)